MAKTNRPCTAWQPLPEGDPFVPRKDLCFVGTFKPLAIALSSSVRLRMGIHLWFGTHGHVQKVNHNAIPTAVAIPRLGKICQQIVEQIGFSTTSRAEDRHDLDLCLVPLASETHAKHSSKAGCLMRKALGSDCVICRPIGFYMQAHRFRVICQFFLSLEAMDQSRS